MKVHHVGYLVKDIRKAYEAFQSLGYEYEKEPKYDSIRDALICFIKNGTQRVELIQPKSKESPLYGLMSKYRNSPYHICYETDDLEESAKAIRKHGFLMINPPEEAPCMDSHDVAFFNHPHIGIIELVEKSPWR